MHLHQPKYLGVVFDSSLNLHIPNRWGMFLSNPWLASNSKNLFLDLAKENAVALVSAKVDYCNLLFHNMPKEDIGKLQRVQNCIAIVVNEAPRFSRSIPILKGLHWLPVKFRNHFKTCTINFLTLKDNHYAYLNFQNIHPPQIRRVLLFFAEEPKQFELGPLRI